MHHYSSLLKHDMSLAVDGLDIPLTNSGLCLLLYVSRSLSDN